MKPRSIDLAHGPKWLRKAFDDLRADFLSGVVITGGLGTTITESPTGTAVNIASPRKIKQHLCEGDIVGIWPDAPDEEVFDIIVGLPYQITVTQLTLFVGAGAYSIHLGYGGEGEGVSFMSCESLLGGTPYLDGVTDDDGIVGPQTVGALTLHDDAEFLVDGFIRAVSCNQIVPAGGYLQWNTIDRLDAGDITFYIHYKYNCSDGSPL